MVVWEEVPAWVRKALRAAISMFLENNLLLAMASHSPTNMARHKIEHGYATIPTLRLTARQEHEAEWSLSMSLRSDDKP